MKISFTLLLTLLLLGTIPVTRAGEPWPADIVMHVGLANVLNREFKVECEKRFPDLKEKINQSFKASPINSIVIHEYLNGGKYRNLPLHALVQWKREMSEMRRDSQDSAAIRKECENSDAVFSRVTKEYDVVNNQQDFDALLDWAKKGTPASEADQAPIEIDTTLHKQMAKEEFWNNYPKEFRDRSLLTQNIVRYVQQAQLVAKEIKGKCDEKFPEGRAKHDRIYSDWPYRQYKAITIVNGREYNNPFLEKVARRQWIPSIFGSDEKAQEMACRDLSGTLDKVSRRAGLNWIASLSKLLIVENAK
jgi:hypothetical protein